MIDWLRRGKGLKFRHINEFQLLLVIISNFAWPFSSRARKRGKIRIHNLSNIFSCATDHCPPARFQDSSYESLMLAAQSKVQTDITVNIPKLIAPVVVRRQFLLLLL